VRARGVVVGEVRAQQAAEMTLIEDDDVVQAFAADRADQAFGEGILPGGAGAMRTSRMPMSAIWRVNSSP